MSRAPTTCGVLPCVRTTVATTKRRPSRSRSSIRCSVSLTVARSSTHVDVAQDAPVARRRRSQIVPRRGARPRSASPSGDAARIASRQRRAAAPPGVRAGRRAAARRSRRCARRSLDEGPHGVGMRTNGMSPGSTAIGAPVSVAQTDLNRREHAARRDRDSSPSRTRGSPSRRITDPHDESGAPPRGRHRIPASSSAPIVRSSSGIPSIKARSCRRQTGWRTLRLGRGQTAWEDPTFGEFMIRRSGDS